jgi:D-alanyl-D-alanine carboxypeptidase
MEGMESMNPKRLNMLLLATLIPLLLYVALQSLEAIRSPRSAEAVRTGADASRERLPYANQETAGELAVVVNREHPLPADYVPGDLAAPDISFIFEGEHEKRLLREPAARAVKQLFAAAEQDGIRLYGVSGYRSYDTQKALFAFNVRSKGESHASRYSAIPGASEHQTGLALDVTAESVDYRLLPAFADTKEGRWLSAHAHEYGFVIRYPKDKEHITGYAYEPWHIRFVGRSTALSAFTYQVTLEEMAASALPVFSQ